MKLRNLLVPAALLLALTTNSHAQWFARAMITRVDPSWEGYSGATGAGITGGRFFGARQQHEVSLDVSSAKWEADEFDSGLRLKGDETHTPVLLNYRYHVTGSDEFRNVQFYLGPCVGYTRSKVDFTITGLETGPVQLEDSDWVFSWGGNAGFLVTLTRNLELEVGYRYLKLSDASYSFLDTSIEADSAHFNIYYAGLSVRF